MVFFTKNLFHDRSFFFNFKSVVNLLQSKIRYLNQCWGAGAGSRAFFEGAGAVKPIYWEPDPVKEIYAKGVMPFLEEG